MAAFKRTVSLAEKIPTESPYRNMPTHTSVVKRILVLLLGVLFLIAAYWSYRLGRADLLFRKGTQESVSRAVDLLPGHSQYRVRRSEWNEAGRIADLKAAVALNRYNSQAWIELGLIAERQNDFAGAERCLLEAAEVDKTFVPRWTLANYYFRRQEEDEFWCWAREALEMSYGDVTALYRLCWRLSSDPSAILDQVIPEDPDHLVRYLLFLLKEDRLTAAEPVAARLIPTGGARHKAILLGYCDRLIAAKEVTAALETWNCLLVNRLLSYAVLSPGNGASLTNGDFAVPPLSHGFDWRVPSTNGIAASLSDAPKYLKISVSGRQPERCNLLVQYVPLVADSEYRFQYSFMTSGASPDSGLRWRVFDESTGAELASSAESLSRDDWGTGRLVFRTGAETTLARLTLRYERAPGTVRLEGSLALRKVSLELLGGPQDHVR